MRRACFLALLTALPLRRGASLSKASTAGARRCWPGTSGRANFAACRPVEDSLQGGILWYDPFIPPAETTLGATLNVKLALR